MFAYDISQQADEMRLASITNPANGETVRFFKNWEKACQHLEDHVLSSPECEAWRLVTPEIENLMALDDEKLRLRLVRDARQTAGVAAQALYDCYARAVDADCLDARAVGWHATRDDVTVAVGTSGVHVIVEGRAVVTAYLPGQGSAEATAASQRIPFSSARLARHRPMGGGILAGPHDQQHPKEQHLAERRYAGWTREQKLFYRVFRRALQFVMNLPDTSYDLLGRRFKKHDSALLKVVLPKRRRMKFEDWMELRRRCQRT